MARHGPALVHDRSGGSNPALLSREERTNFGAQCGASPASATIRVPLVPVVVGCGQSICFLLLVGRQAQLLRPVRAGHGIADRRRVGRAGAGRGVGRRSEANRSRLEASCKRSGYCSSLRRLWPRSWHAIRSKPTAGRGAWSSGWSLRLRSPQVLERGGGEEARLHLRPLLPRAWSDSWWLTDRLLRRRTPHVAIEQWRRSSMGSFRAPHPHPR